MAAKFDNYLASCQHGHFLLLAIVIARRQVVREAARRVVTLKA